MARVRAGIVGVTGYSGAELARLLTWHPEVELAEVTGRSAIGQPVGAVFPHLDALGLTVRERVETADLVFTALPHGASMEAVSSLVREGRRVIDISADFRLKDVATYQRWYGRHSAPELMAEAVYGLPELRASEVAAARLVANPGCYATAAVLALAPIAHLIQGEAVVDAKSGISGAGRTQSLTVNHFCEVNESCQAYSLEGHRHQPEMVQELEALRRARAAPGALDITFVPHLVPMTRGILATCYARVEPSWQQGQLFELYAEFYRGKPFVRVVGSSPATKHTLGTNLCLVHPRLEEATGRVVVVSCIDNLVKGAAGQAVQNMNIMLGLPETTGLGFLALYP